MITGFARTTAEVSAAMRNNVPDGRQPLWWRRPEALDTRLPKVAALLADRQDRLAHSAAIDHHPHRTGQLAT
jgi:hypothetical protein